MGFLGYYFILFKVTPAKTWRIDPLLWLWRTNAHSGPGARSGATEKEGYWTSGSLIAVSAVYFGPTWVFISLFVYPPVN